MKHLNIEIKAICPNPEKIREILKDLKADYKGCDHQIDTYFKNNNGRLKLRSGNIENSLIFYKRDNQAGPKASHVILEKISKDSNIKKILTASNEVLVEVDKKREISFIDNVKFHLDEVIGLGSFVEIEAIDLDGSIGSEKLLDQCQKYMGLFSIKTEDLIECSYSDLILVENNKNYKQYSKEANNFLTSAFNDLSKLNINIDNNFCDHICFRVKNKHEYFVHRKNFSEIGTLLIESIVSGRNISTFKLYKPFYFEDRKIDVVELPEPKPNNQYETGFEHLEFVIEESFEEYLARYKNHQFNLKGAQKAFNPEIQLNLKEDRSVKFHHMPLEKVIEIEKTVRE